MKIEKKEPLIFVIAGQAQHGKDTLALMIRTYYEALGKKTIALQFSSYIKQYALNITDWDGLEETKPREFLQYLGTDLIRKEIDSEIFVNRTIEDIKVYSYFYDVITISDARFDNEVAKIKQAFPKAIAIKIERPGYVIDGYAGNHSTEHGLINNELYDNIIINDGTIGNLNKKIIKLLEEKL